MSLYTTLSMPGTGVDVCIKLMPLVVSSSAVTSDGANDACDGGQACGGKFVIYQKVVTPSDI